MKVLVIGDSCQDVFRYGTCDRLSPEAPVPIFLPTRTTGNGGMVINVFENLKALGIECEIITNDIRPVKTRYVDEVSNQMLLRVDERDETYPITADTLQSINYGDYDAIVISDYNKGYLREADIRYVAEHHPLVFMDTKKKIGNWAKDVEFIKLNEKEFNENWFTDFELYYNGNLIITKGKKGARHIDYRDQTATINDFPINNEHEVRDLSGAGDTFLAGLVVDYINNNDICKAIEYANKCAAWVVTQKGVVVVDKNKIK